MMRNWKGHLGSSENVVLLRLKYDLQFFRRRGNLTAVKNEHLDSKMRLRNVTESVLKVYFQMIFDKKILKN